MSADLSHPQCSPLALAKGEPISFSSVTKCFGSTFAVDRVSLEVRAGEFLSLLGPSGSGKTTLLMMVAGFERPTSGAIRLGNRDLTHVPPNKRGVGMVFQRYALFPHMTVADNIAFPLRMRNFAAAEIGRRVDATLALVRLEGYGARKPSQLSGGQQQRVAVARALVFEPPVMLMDEPLGALDKKLREELQIEFKRLHQKLGLTIVYVTHDQDEAMAMSDRIAVMNHGGIEQIGSPVDIYGTPVSRFVADFIGKMNFLPGTVLESTEKHAVVSVLGTPLTITRGPGRSQSIPLGPVTLAVRPQHTRIEPAPSSRAPGSIRGTIDTVVFSGTHTSLIIALAGGSAVTVQTTAEIAPRQGEPVQVSLDLARVHLFPTGG
ncbi:MAG: ABC transporter ATP-binding protein [Hyphomicrobiaceae bacterium]|nr:MAG: ABC transporter ATP-binding protein [Hyphomicrobiaceae bacterium]